MAPPGIRKRTHAMLDIAERGDLIGRIVDISLISLIAVNVVAVILESVPALATEYGTFFHRFEVFSVAVFTIEYVLRV